MIYDSSYCGELFRDRGINDGDLARWFAGRPIAVNATHQIKGYCGITSSTYYQQVDNINSTDTVGSKRNSSNGFSVTTHLLKIVRSCQSAQQLSHMIASTRDMYKA